MRTVAAITTSNIRNWIRTSDLDNLELVVLEGHGQKLLTENASDNKIRQFLKSVPGYIVSCAHFVSRGQQQTNPTISISSKRLRQYTKPWQRGASEKCRLCLGRRSLQYPKMRMELGFCTKQFTTTIGTTHWLTKMYWADYFQGHCGLAGGQVPGEHGRARQCEYKLSHSQTGHIINVYPPPS